MNTNEPEYCYFTSPDGKADHEVRCTPPDKGDIVLINDKAFIVVVRELEIGDTVMWRLYVDQVSVP